MKSLFWMGKALGATLLFFSLAAYGQTGYGTDNQTGTGVPQIGTQPGTGGTCTCPDGSPGTWSTAYGDLDGGLQNGQCICATSPDAGSPGTGLNMDDAGVGGTGLYDGTVDAGTNINPNGIGTGASQGIPAPPGSPVTPGGTGGVINPNGTPP